MRLGETPVPIPNTMVKTQAADGTTLETMWESRWPPDQKRCKTVRFYIYNGWKSEFVPWKLHIEKYLNIKQDIEVIVITKVMMITKKDLQMTHLQAPITKEDDATSSEFQAHP